MSTYQINVIKFDVVFKRTLLASGNNHHQPSMLMMTFKTRVYRFMMSISLKNTNTSTK